MCRQLENYGVDIDNDSLQTEIIEKMPPREKNELIWFQLEKEETTTKMILEQMKKIALKAEIASNNFTKTSFIPPQTFSKTPTTYPQSFMKTPQNPNRIPLQQNNNGYKSSSKNFACSFCDDDHSSVRCPKFVTSDERIQQLKTKNCCTQCTKPDHNESQCESNVVCRICQGHHYSFLCDQWNNTNYQKSNNSNTFISIEAQQGCLLTKKVRVSNPVTNENIDATVLFDPGSQRSFVSDRLIRQLKLPWEAKEKLELQGIGAKATNYVSTKVKLQIKTSESFKDIFANSMPKIANSVSLVTFDENDLTKITITETTPDILIGMDYFFTFITSFERKNDLVIVHSEVGQMLSGKIQTSQNNTVSTLAIEKEKPQFYRKPSYWKSKAMGSRREATNTQGKQVHEMFKKSNFDKTKRMKKFNEETKPQHSKQLQNLKRLHHPRTFYNSNISSTIKSLIVGKQFLSIIKQEKVQCELNTNNLSGGGEYPAEIKTCSSRKQLKKTHKTESSNGEKKFSGT
uniref:Peptidase A2 domain-containing protein n=1 Tax=Panagrolaimus davidi TaxID=227884 RepID=A0A914P901_9BILA